MNSIARPVPSLARTLRGVSRLQAHRNYCSVNLIGDNLNGRNHYVEAKNGRPCRIQKHVWQQPAIGYSQVRGYRKSSNQEAAKRDYYQGKFRDCSYYASYLIMFALPQSLG
jgi:hypothetical protein